MSITITRNPAIGGAAGGGASPADVAAAVIAAMPAPATGAVSGEVKLFALSSGQSLPANWTLDTSREVVAADLPTTAIMPLYSPVAAGTATTSILLQLSDGIVTWGNTGNLVKSNPATGAQLFSVAPPHSFIPGELPMVCTLLGKPCFLGGSISGTMRATVYETGSTGVHSTLNDLPAARKNGSAIELPGGRVLVVGGQTSAGVSAELLVFTRGVGWQTLTTEALDEPVLWPHLATLPSGKIGIFSGAANGTSTRSTKYYTFDPVTLKRSAAKTIPAQYQPYAFADTMTLRTANGCAYLTGNPAVDGTFFSEYNEALDSFSTFQMKLPGNYVNPQASNTSHCVAQDLVAGPYGHVFLPSSTAVKPYVALKSGAIPTYRFARKD